MKAAGPSWKLRASLLPRDIDNPICGQLSARTLSTIGSNTVGSSGPDASNLATDQDLAPPIKLLSTSFMSAVHIHDQTKVERSKEYLMLHGGALTRARSLEYYAAAAAATPRTATDTSPPPADPLVPLIAFSEDLGPQRTTPTRGWMREEEWWEGDEREGKMRTICDVCESAPAVLFCAADEAALCRPCDEKVPSWSHFYG
ncbi:hypothetical protein B296_00006751 [Ensete ventricosum]|uniref:B box-type domain-containing protein n=1 Tax=Ensete ventricosum TaxID=4639 RepID=A0A427AG17_ENSVE|nr:hypothetical protein B296_00006751 [Ensete ventricosum]